MRFYRFSFLIGDLIEYNNVSELIAMFNFSEARGSSERGRTQIYR